MRILTLSGWGQPHNALADIVVDTVPEATHFDYSHYANIEDALTGIAAVAKNKDAVIGWSLGGQLAVRAISAGLMRPEKLVLISVPFQFVRSEAIKLGMPRDVFQKFRDNYEKNASRTLEKAWELIAIGDKNHDHIRAQLAKHTPEDILAKNWLRWLDMLDGFSCSDLDYSKFPSSLLIHGAQDAVVNYSQIHEFSKSIPHNKHIILPDAGHAPHWHDNRAIKQYVDEYLNV